MFDEILGLTLEKGLKIIESQGYTYKINKYQTPRNEMDDFDLAKGRIVRVKLICEKSIELTVCNLTTPF